MAMFFPGAQIVQDRYERKSFESMNIFLHDAYRSSRAHAIPLIDNQQDCCIIQTNITDQNVYVSFERYSTTGDIDDIDLTSDVYLMFSMGIYTFSNDSNTFNPQDHFFRKSFETNVNLIHCISSKTRYTRKKYMYSVRNLASCSTSNCSITSCPCLQEIQTDIGQCVCFPPSSCVSGSTISSVISTTNSSISAIINGTIDFLRIFVYIFFN